MRTVAILLCLVALALAQIGTRCSVGDQVGSCIDTNSQNCQGQIWSGYCPGARNIRCCTGDSGGSDNSGGSDFGGSPPSTGGFPTTFTTSGYTYRGKNAQTLHFLKSQFGANPTTYSSHSDGPTQSADLWTQGAAYGKDNRNIPSMNQLAEYVAANERALGIKYVIWKQRINSGDSRGWRNMADRGGITANHYDHVHITFSGSSSALNSDSQQTFTQSQGQSSDEIPAWAIPVIIMNVIAFIAVAVTVVVVFRAFR